MREIYFVFRVIVLTLLVVVVLQIEYKGETIETKASHLFGNSNTIEAIKESSRTLVNKIKEHL